MKSIGRVGSEWVTLMSRWLSTRVALGLLIIVLVAPRD